MRVVRVPVAFRVSKGVVMPTYGFEATRQVLGHDVLSVHLPQLDAWGACSGRASSAGRACSRITATSSFPRAR